MYRDIYNLPYFGDTHLRTLVNRDSLEQKIGGIKVFGTRVPEFRKVQQRFRRMPVIDTLPFAEQHELRRAMCVGHT